MTTSTLNYFNDIDTSMEATRRFWIDAAFVVGLAAPAVLFSRPVLLVGATTVGAWLLGRQYRSARSLVDSAERFGVTRPAAERTVRTDDPFPTVLSDPDAFEDPDDAHARYSEFEECRWSIGRMDRASAFEIAPGDYLRTAISAGSVSDTTIKSLPKP